MEPFHYYFKSDREGEREKDFPSIVSLPKCPHQPGMGQAKGRILGHSQVSHAGSQGLGPSLPAACQGARQQDAASEVEVRSPGHSDPGGGHAGGILAARDRLSPVWLGCRGVQWCVLGCCSLGAVVGSSPFPVSAPRQGAHNCRLVQRSCTDLGQRRASWLPHPVVSGTSCPA